MKIRVQITTPKGQARKAQKKLKYFIIGSRKAKIETYVNKEDNELVWEVEGSVKQIMKIQYNVNKFDLMMGMALNNKYVRKKINNHLSKEEVSELDEMLLKQTTCKIIKEATANELVEKDKTWIERVKDNFRKESL
jgi:hypothetical protein|tara:strand:+ start:207 stop:614 length:408 start_codon:yes stop_codon:yes gene_type:complete